MRFILIRRSIGALIAGASLEPRFWRSSCFVRSRRCG